MMAVTNSATASCHLRSLKWMMWTRIRQPRGPPAQSQVLNLIFRSCRLQRSRWWMHQVTYLLRSCRPFHLCLQFFYLHLPPHLHSRHNDLPLRTESTSCKIIEEPRPMDLTVVSCSYYYYQFWILLLIKNFMYPCPQFKSCLFHN